MIETSQYDNIIGFLEDIIASYIYRKEQEQEASIKVVEFVKKQQWKEEAEQAERYLTSKLLETKQYAIVV